MRLPDVWERFRDWLFPRKPNLTPEQVAYRELMRDKHYADRT